MYLAHISKDHSREQSIKEHLEGTAALAGKFADSFGCGAWGEGCGMLHDIGKYSEAFQKRLHDGPRTDHSTAGAKELWKSKNLAAAYCVMGHHSGLPDGGTAGDSGGEPTLMGRLKKDVENYQVFQEEIKMPSFPQPPLKPLGEGGFSLSFFIRMLFSCLVDADRLDTEAFMEEGNIQRGGADSMEVLLERLQKHVKGWMSNMDTLTVNGRRTEILKSCFEQGDQEQGLFQLTVPTGGGKTVSSLAFALQHAVKHGLKHIIYVIPYTSIIEQNAQIFKDILGKENVIEHHCNVVCDDPEELKHNQLAAENWDQPVIVTTNVQFFESLFANKGSKCRKLHNISKSVIIFDEAQMLPVPYLKPCIAAMSELIYNYHSTAVLCTATQPYLQQFFPKEICAKEICPNLKEQFLFFRRTTVEKLGELTEAGLAERLKGQKQALCILNSRKRVQNIYRLLEKEGTYQISTLMYPEHRKRLLKEVCTRLEKGRECRFIATSLVEAGVDFDFKMVYREMAGLDSVIQAAGRCNREGKRERDECITSVFTLEAGDEIHLPPGLKLPISVGEKVSEQFDNISSPEAMEAYFSCLFKLKGEGLDAKDIIKSFEAGSCSFLFPFAEAAGRFRLIENDTKTILVDVEEKAAEIVERIRRGEYSRQLIRDAGRYCVNVYDNDFKAMEGAGLLEQIENDFYVLRDKAQYSEELGLQMNVSRGDGVFW